MASERMYRMLPELCNELNVDAILPYLMSHDVISVENFEKLHIAKERNTRRQLVFSLMPMIRCPQLFLCALEESQNDAPVHATLAKRLRAEVFCNWSAAAPPSSPHAPPPPPPPPFFHPHECVIN